MARNTRRSNGMKKIEPAPLRLTFTLSATGAGNVATDYIDLSQVASLVNRRFYRQGINWAVAGLKFVGTNDATIYVSKLPSTWVMSNAWEKGFRAWQKMNNEALEEAESVKPKFLDFKIYADAGHHDVGFAANLLPTSIDPGAPGAVPNTAAPGEWESSKFVYSSSATTNAVTTVECVAVGPNFGGASTATGLNAVSLIEGYAASRALPDIADPNTPGDADDVGPTATPENWLGSLFTEGTQQDATVLNDMQTENNIAPYPFENDGVNNDTMYPGGANQLSGLEIHDIETVTPTTVGGATRMPGGMFPCGLMRIDVDATQGTQYALLIDLVPGDHRGYLCEPMTEM